MQLLVTQAQARPSSHPAPTPAPIQTTSAGSKPESPLITERQRARQLEQAIRSDPTFRSLAPTDKARAEHILRVAANRSPEEHLYYVTALRALLRTPYAGKTPEEGSQALGAINESIMFEAVLQEQNRTEWKSVEELLSGMGSQSVRAGLDGKTYRVNRENPDLVVVQVKVRLSGESQHVALVRALEDAIEKAASTRGYHNDEHLTETLSAANRGEHVVVSTVSDPESGWVGRHAYTVLNVREENGVTLVTLRNPWGYWEPAGTNGFDGSDDGTFTVSLDDLRANMRGVYTNAPQTIRSTFQELFATFTPVRLDLQERGLPATVVT